jgi:hypothetical protein
MVLSFVLSAMVTISPLTGLGNSVRHNARHCGSPLSRDQQCFHAFRSAIKYAERYIRHVDAKHLFVPIQAICLESYGQKEDQGNMYGPAVSVITPRLHLYFLYIVRQKSIHVPAEWQVSTVIGLGGFFHALCSDSQALLGG